MVASQQEGMDMRRPIGLMSVAAVVLLGVATAGWTSGASAQEASPPPGGFEIAPGVTAEALAFVPGQEAPALYRLTFAPGVTYTIMPAPDISLVYQETGGLVFTLDAPVTITRAGAADKPGEAIAADAEFALNAGDYTTFPALVGGEARNDGEEPASAVVASIVPPEGMATPAA